ncbi:MAG: MFS transporter [Oscillospiraceae bacterium]|jgi:PPP family 3-phenylpropionic acid transporter|nr:MFS transporter [Oscillospiraceae bacterium]
MRIRDGISTLRSMKISPSLIKGRTKIFLENEQNRVFLSYAGLQVLFHAALSIGNYLTVFLQQSGFTPSQVGMINALNAAISIFATPFWGAASDRIRSIRKIVIICVIGMLVTFPLIPMSAGATIFGISLVYLIVPAAHFFKNPAISLVDNWIVRTVNERRMNYGSIRGLGSLFFALTGFLMGMILPKIGVRATFFLSPVLLIPFLILSIRTKSDAIKGKKLSMREMGVDRLFKNYSYVSHLIFSVCVSISLNGAGVFMPYLITSIGADSAQFGFITGYVALIEVPMLMFLSGYLRRKFPLRSMLLMSGVFFGIELILDSFAGALWQLVLISTLRGLGNGLFIAAQGNYIYSMAPDELKATAQMLNSALCSVAAIVGILMGGALIGAVDIGVLYVILGIVAAAGTLLYLVSCHLGKKGLKIDTDGKLT